MPVGTLVGVGIQVVELPFGALYAGWLILGASFLERRQGEARRISLLGPRVNRARALCYLVACVQGLAPTDLIVDL
jgi:hypothetical protein